MGKKGYVGFNLFYVGDICETGDYVILSGSENVGVYTKEEVHSDLLAMLRRAEEENRFMNWYDRPVKG